MTDTHDKHHGALPLERLKTEAERLIPYITGNRDATQLADAARNLRDIIQRAHDLGTAAAPSATRRGECQPGQCVIADESGPLCEAGCKRSVKCPTCLGLKRIPNIPMGVSESPCPDCSTPSATGLRLEPLDLSKAQKHEHPDINDEDHYLARWHDEWYFGTFNRQWYGWNFHCGFGASGGFQFDAPGQNSSGWQELYRLVPPAMNTVDRGTK